MTPHRHSSAAPQACLGQVVAVLRGRAVPCTRPGSRSAIAKSPVTGPVAVAVAVGTLDLEGDEQGDLP